MLLRQLLYRTETRLLPVIAGYWLHLPDKTNYEEIIRLLCEKMPDAGSLKKILAGPGGKELSAGLGRLAALDGMEPVDSFESEFGTMRVAGIDRILREKYWKDPVSVTEMLFYRGLIYRHNRFVSDTVTECYIIPDDLLKALRPLLPAEHSSGDTQTRTLIVRPAIPAETVSVLRSEENLPETFSLAAAMKRSGAPFRLPGTEITDEYAGFIGMLLSDSGMFPEAGEPDAEAIRRFLVSNRTAALLRLVKTWRESSSYDELRENKAGLIITEPPVYDKTKPREHIIRYLSLLEPDMWWSLSGFITALKNAEPSFLRRYITNERWIISDPDGNDLSGQGSWFQLEGAYIRFLLFGPLRWLGIIQTAYSDKEKNEPAAFRISRDGLFYLSESGNADIPKEIGDKPSLDTAAPNISADGAVICASGTSRYFLYMAARFMELEKFRDRTCSFRLTPNSLSDAEKNGLSRESLLSMLRRFSKNAIPPSLERLLSNSKGHGIPATIYNATILTIPDSGIIEDLISSSRLSKWVIQQINQNSLVIDPKGIADIRRFLMEKEVFVDIRI